MKMFSDSKAQLAAEARGIFHEAEAKRRTMTPEVSAQRSAVSLLIGRCEGLISNRLIPVYEATRLLELLNKTCAAFEMKPPNIDNDEKEAAI